MIEKSKNITKDTTIQSGGSVHIGDRNNIIHNYNGKPIPKILGQPPFYPNFFIGRDSDLEAIHQCLFQNDNLLLLVNGQGGVGKTTVASRYYYRYQDDYEHLAWVFAERSLLDALLTLALVLKPPFEDTMTNEQRLHLLIIELTNLKKPCLLIVDNANELNDLEQYAYKLRACPNLHLLMTTRITEFPGAECYPITQLPVEKALELFQKYYPKHQLEEDKIFLQIRTAVDGNTLVLELLAKNLAQRNRLKTNYSLSDLLKDLQEKGLLALSQSATVGVSYHGKGELRKASPEAIIAAMYDLSELTPDEVALLSVFAVLPAENIAFTMLETLLPSTETLEQSLLALAQKGWLEYNEADTSFKISPVVQEITRHKNREQLLEHCQPLLDSLIEKLDYEGDIGHFLNATYEAAAAYARYGESVVENLSKINESLRILCERLGSYSNTTGNLENARNFFTVYQNYAQQLCEAYPENEDYKNGLAISYSKLGTTHSALGNLDKALQYYEDYNRLEQELYESYPTNVSFKNVLAISYQYLGITHSALGNLDKALQFYEDYNRLEKELYESYPTNISFKNGLAISYEKLGTTHSALGNLDKALQYYEDYNQLREELYDSYPTNVSFKNGLAISYEKLGSTHSDLGNLDKALQYYEQDAQLSKELYKSYPTNVSFKNGLAISYEKLGNTHSALGKLDKALQFFEDETVLFEELYESYPTNISFKNGLAISYWKLGDFYRKQGDAVAARSWFQQAEGHLAELAAAFPAYVEFGRYLEIVRRDLAKLG